MHNFIKKYVWMNKPFDIISPLFLNFRVFLLLLNFKKPSGMRTCTSFLLACQLICNSRYIIDIWQNGTVVAISNKSLSVGFCTITVSHSSEEYKTIISQTANISYVVCSTSAENIFHCKKCLCCRI